MPWKAARFIMHWGRSLVPTSVRVRTASTEGNRREEAPRQKLPQGRRILNHLTVKKKSQCLLLRPAKPYNITPGQGSVLQLGLPRPETPPLSLERQAEKKGLSG